MSGYPIPEDLKELYQSLSVDPAGYCHYFDHADEDIKPLIERIARLSSENTRLREALEHIANDGMDARQCMEMARAALAEKGTK